jgi:DNA invertase Pin-like site-specific DNA recombinase
MARKSRKHIAVTGDAIAATAEKVYNTAIYARLSVEDSGKNDDGDSIENQVYMVKQFVEERPYLSHCGTFIDNGETGVTFDRPRWNALMDGIKAGRINCIVVKDLSRFGRNYIETGNLLEKVFPFLGVRFISVNDNYDTERPENNSECLAIALKSLINDVYAKDISRKSTAALETKQRNGEFIGTYASYGYMKSAADNHKIVIDEETAPVVRHIFRWKIEGMGNNAIARRLNDMGIPSPNRYRYGLGLVKDARYANLLWINTTVKSILENAVYTGCLVQGRKKTRLAQGLGPENLAPDKWVVAPNTHEPIISRETFGEVQEILRKIKTAYHEKAGKYADIGNPENIFKGLVSCGDCGVNLSRYKTVNRNGKVYYNYICPNYERNQTRACPHRKGVGEPLLIESVWNAVRAEIALFADMERLALKVQKGGTVRARAKTIKERITEAKRKIERAAVLSTTLYGDYADGILSESEYLFAKAKFREEKRLWEQRLDELAAEEIKHTGAFVSDNKWIAALSRFRDSKELTREMLLAVVERVIVSGSNDINVVFKHRDEFDALMLHISESGVSEGA